MGYRGAWQEKSLKVREDSFETEFERKGVCLHQGNGCICQTKRETLRNKMTYPFQTKKIKIKKREREKKRKWARRRTKRKADSLI